MIGSLLYLTSSRPDIMFAVCACARYQVNPKVSHLHAVKIIFRYLKGQPKLGLWYLKDSPFDLVAYTDNDYAGASLDMNSTTGGCQLLGYLLTKAFDEKRIDAIDQDEDITLVNVQDAAEMFDVNDLCGKEVFVAEQEVVKDVNENVAEEVVNAVQDSNAKTTITIEENTLAQALEALKTSKPKEEILAREKAEKEQETNIALIETWEDIQEKIDADHQLAERLQKRRNHFAAKRAEKKRNKPPTQAQQRKITFTYLRNMKGYMLKQLKPFEFDKIKEMFNKAFRRVNTFEDFRTELVEGKEKRVGEEFIQESTKKQKVEDDKETSELKQLMEIILDKEEVAIDAIPLSVKSPKIVDWKIHKEGKKAIIK
nr:uncharacterized mitochondrial protein AtMg00810-like [Tanacetum cinerariifolium]